MDTTPCSKLINLLKAKYTVTNLDEFLAAGTESNDPFQITISTKDDTELASISTNFEHAQKEIFVGYVARTNLENPASKGLGKALLYIVVCKAIQMGYKVVFAAAVNSLYPYYNSLGFKRSSRVEGEYVTLPTEEGFSTKIQKTVNNLTASLKGGTRSKRKHRKTRRQKRRKTL